MPFLYAALYIIALSLYPFISEEILVVIDTLLYVSPTVVFGNLILSRMLELCYWHKAACILPIVPQITILIDRYIYEFSVYGMKAHLAVVILMSALLLVAAYKVFLSPKHA